MNAAEPIAQRGPARQRLGGRRPGTATRQGVLAIADQAVVSASRFALTVLVGRLAGVDELGLYAVSFSAIMIAAVTQESLLLSPYAVLGNQVRDQTRRRALGAVCVGWVGGALLVAAALLLAAGVLIAIGRVEQKAWIQLLLTLTIAGPGVLMHGLARRVAYAHLSVASALRLDVAVGLVQVLAVVGLWAADALSAETALLSLGVAGAVGGVIWWWRHRQLVCCDRRAVQPWLRRYWRFGRWILGSQQVRAVSGLLVTTVLAAMAGAGEAGRYAAAALVVVAANPLLLGLGGVMESKAAAAWASGGTAELRRVVRKVTGFMAAVLACYVVFAAVIGEALLEAVFADPTYQGLGHAITILASAMLVRGVRIGWNNAIKAMRKPAWNLIAGVCELAVLTALILPFAIHSGLIGAAYAILLASAVGSAIRAGAYLRLARAAGGNETHGS